MVQYLKKYRVILVFFLCSILVFFIHFTLYQPVIQYRLFNLSEDWPFLILYKSLYPNPLASVFDVWTKAGLHTTAQIYHIGILSDFLMFNYQGYQIVNVALKAIGTLSFFPLIMVLFRNKKLAFLATTLFGISSATAGSFLWVVKGSEYLGIMFLNIFLITYYYVILKNSKLLLLLSAFLFLLAYLLAPPRMFPQLLLIPIIEIVWLFRTQKLKNLKSSITRIIVYCIPVILVSLSAPVSSCCPFASRPLILFRDIVNGGWHNFLDPFAGIGWTLITNDFWQFFGVLELDTFANFNNYARFLLRPILIFGLLTLVLAPILSKKPKQFFTLVFGVNLLLEVLIFFIANYEFTYLEILEMQHDIGHFLYTKYPTLIGLYIFVIVLACFLEWKKDRKNKLLQAIWIGPLFSAVFLWPTWIIMGPLINDYSSVHWYFGISAMGTTLFMGAILVLFYEKLKYRILLRRLAIFVILGIIFVFYHTHGTAIAKQYLGINPEKVSLTDQQIIQGQLISKLGSSAKNGDVLVYLDIAEDLINLRRTIQYYKEALVIPDFGYWVHFRRRGDGEINNGCINVIIEKKLLKSIVHFRNNEVEFVYEGICVNKTDSFSGKSKVSYRLDSFYAFRLQNGEFIDIKKETLKELTFDFP